MGGGGGIINPITIGSVPRDKKGAGLGKGSRCHLGHSWPVGRVPGVALVLQ